MMRSDFRIPVRFGPLDSRGPNEAVLLDHAAACAEPVARFEAEAPHLAGCACCNGRSAASVALAALFRARVLSDGPLFTAVLADVGGPGEAAVREALANDPLAFMRFRTA